MSRNTIGIKLKHGPGVMFYIPSTNEFRYSPLQQQESLIEYYSSDLELSISQEKITEELEDTYNKIEDEKLAKAPSIGFCILTNQCNMNCSFCYAFKNTDEFQESFKVEWLDKLKTVLREESFTNCNFSGGEPLLEFETVKKMRPYFKDVTIYTNGSLINEEIALWLIETKTKIYVNLDYEIEGFEGHDTKNVRENLERLSIKYPELRQFITISIVVQPHHIQKINELRKQSKDFEKTSLHEFNFVEGGEIKEESIIEEIKKLEAGEITLDSSIFLRQLRYISTAIIEGMNVVSCDPSITINYRGDVLLCHEYASSHQPGFYEKYKVSNVNDFTAEKYISSAMKLRKRGPCKEKECSARWFCGGICWANIKVNPYLCDVARMMLPYALYLALNYGNANMEAAFNKDYVQSITVR